MGASGAGALACGIGLGLALAFAPPAGRADDLPRLPDGRLEPGCDAVADAPSLATQIEFVGGLQFAEGTGAPRPRDPDAALASLEVGDLRIAGDARKWVFLEKKLIDHGFLVRWANEADPAERVALYTSWASLKDPALRARNIVCHEREGG